MNFKLNLARILHDQIKNIFQSDLDIQLIFASIEIPKDESMGDLAFPCFLLAKPLKKAPQQVAADLANSFSDLINKTPFQSIEPTGPYLNFKFKTLFLAKQLLPQVLAGAFTQPEPHNKETMMIEYSQPNTHKSFHVGHIRNVALGSSIAKLNEWAGYKVIPVNYIGDVGTHIAKCLWYFKKYYKGQVPSKNRGEFLGDMYVNGTELLDFTTLATLPFPDLVAAKVIHIEPHPLNKKLNVVLLEVGEAKKVIVCGGSGYTVNDFVVYAPIGSKILGREILAQEIQGTPSEGMICSEHELGYSKERNQIFCFKTEVQTGQPVSEITKLDTALLTCKTVKEEIEKRTQEVEQVLIDLESGKAEISQLWNQTKNWSMENFDENYKWLKVDFNHAFYESEVADAGKQLVKEYLDKGLFEVSEGAVGIDLARWKLPFFLLLKSNGTGLYSTKDLALAKLKFEKYKVDRSVYVVDDGQSLHFQQVFKTLEAMGYENAKKCYHLAYGKVERPDGKMSSRKGNVILFSQLKEMLLNKIKEDFLNKYQGEWAPSEIEDTAHKIALATIKYGMLNQDSRKNIVFDLDEWTARTGNTGPYLMYAFARIQSILRDPMAQNISMGDFDPNQLADPSEHRLMAKISHFRETVIKSSEKFEPQILCIYLYQLAKDFSGFYSQCPVLKSDSEELTKSRLRLVESTGIVLQAGLSLLGIPTVERM